MENVETIKRLGVLIDLSYLKKFIGNKSEFVDKLNIKYGGDVSFAFIFDLLKKNDIIYNVKGTYTWPKYGVDVKKLCAFIEEQPFIKKIKQYFDYLH